MNETTLPKDTILIIDDTSDNLALINGILKDFYYTKLANSGEKGLKIAESITPPDLILLDILMPEMDGYEVCERLKKNPVTSSIPVIFLTAKTEVEDETKGLELGAVDYINKPISPSILLARIKTHLAMKKMQDLLREKNENLTKINAQKDRFLGVVAHDLRNPLSVFQGFCDLLMEDDDIESDEQKEIYQIMYSSSVQMCDLVTDLLDVSQINLGVFSLNKEHIELNPYMQNIVKSNQFIATRKKISLHLLPIAKNTFGYFDSNRIRQVITNLLTNAIKFSHSETNITISAEVNDANFLIVKVTDQGKGIKEDEIPYVFGEFQKTSTTSTAGEQSTGLGLAICRNIILAHHGEIKCESKLNEGSCFYFKIPNFEM